MKHRHCTKWNRNIIKFEYELYCILPLLDMLSGQGTTISLTCQLSTRLLVFARQNDYDVAMANQRSRRVSHIFPIVQNPRS